MKCPACNRYLTTRIAVKSPGNHWVYDYYCDHCRKKVQGKTGRICPSCGFDFREYRVKGYLGCADCYNTFAPELDPLLLKYRGRLPGKKTESISSNTIGSTQEQRLARARTQELLEILLECSRDETTEREGDSLSRESENQMGSPAPQEEGATGEILQSIRIRIARNIQGVHYLTRMGEGEKKLMAHVLLGAHSPFLRMIREKIPEKSEEMEGFETRPGDPYLNRSGPIPHAEFLFGNQAGGSVKIRFFSGDEDHLRVEWILRGLKNREVSHWLEKIQEQIGEIDRTYLWDIHEDYDFLTACPANSGSGMRVSFQLRLPGLYGSPGWGEWLGAFRESGFEVRGEHGEGSLPGPVVQLSNRSVPGRDRLVDHIRRLSVIVHRARKAELDLR